LDLTRGPLLRVLMPKLAEQEHVLLLTVHHIVSDGWSVGVFSKELVLLYEAFSAGKTSPLPELPIQYADFACWQREWLQGDVLRAHLSYWKRQLGERPPALELPTDRPRPAVQRFRGATQSLVLPLSLTEAIKTLSQREGVTLFMTLLAAFDTLLHRRTGQTEMVVGTDVANRNRIEVEDLIGFFVNLLVLRVDLGGNPSFRELLTRVRETTLGAYAHQDLPFDRLVEELRPARDLSRNPLVQVLVVLQNAPMAAVKFSGLKINFVETESETARFDLFLNMVETEQGLKTLWTYNTDLFEAQTIGRLMSQFETLLGSVVATPDAPLDKLEILTESEKKQKAMEQKDRKESKLSKFINAKPKAVSLTPKELVKTELLQPGETLPLVIRPAVDDIDLAEWARGHRDFIEANLLKHGALLFRGFDLTTVSRFEQFASAICPELFGEYGDLPREEVSGRVYTSTPYPPNQPILMHNESSQMHCWPLKIWFYCVRAAQQGGETPIVDSRRIFQRLDPRIRDRFMQKGIMYVRNYTDGVDVRWQDFFNTDDRSAVEDYCRKAGIECEWKDGDGLKARNVCPAVALHPKTGEMVFFNQLQAHHVSCLDPTVRQSLLSLFAEEDLPRNAYYGDGSRIEDSVVDEIREVYRTSTVQFPWQEGDVTMLDNMLAAHGRNPYVGQRKIVVAMGEMVSKREVERAIEEHLKTHSNGDARQ
jgi:alpha-ketoglutarate-dependent taurine dioxygenase